jgi:hypothetical protein
MAISNWWRGYRGQPQVQTLPTREMDSFADNVLFELKTVTAIAITQALEAREPHYMRSILDESYFALESLVIKALDAQTIKDMETFLVNHEAIDLDFRKKFFAQVLQREYRSKRGASVRVDPDLEPIVEFDQSALDGKTEDEAFILSLKGRQIRFEAQAVLRGPISKSKSPRTQAAPAQSGLAQAVTAAGKPQNSAVPQRIHVTVHDKRGKTEQLLALPLVLGKNGTQYAHHKKAFGIDVDATYVSRQQLIVFEVLGDIYCFVPSSASLTWALGDTTIMCPQQLYPLHVGQTLVLLGGIPIDNNERPPARADHADFPRIELRTLAVTTERYDATPRPKAVM